MEITHHPRRLMGSRWTALGTAAVFAAAGAASADVTTFTDRASYDAAVAGASYNAAFESFELLPQDGGSAARDEVVTPGFTLSAVNEGFTFLSPLSVLGATGPGGTFATDGGQHVNVGSLYNTTQNNDVVVSFSFSEVQVGFFLDLTDLLGLDQASAPRAFLTTDSGASLEIFGPGNPGAVLRSIGLVDTAGFTTVTIRATAGDSFGIDAVSSAVVPTPAGMALLGLGGLAAARRRR